MSRTKKWPPGTGCCANGPLAQRRHSATAAAGGRLVPGAGEHVHGAVERGVPGGVRRAAERAQTGGEPQVVAHRGEQGAQPLRTLEHVRGQRAVPVERGQQRRVGQVVLVGQRGRQVRRRAGSQPDQHRRRPARAAYPLREAVGHQRAEAVPVERVGLVQQRPELRVEFVQQHGRLGDARLTQPGLPAGEPDGQHAHARVEPAAPARAKVSAPAPAWWKQNSRSPPSAGSRPVAGEPSVVRGSGGAARYAFIPPPFPRPGDGAGRRGPDVHDWRWTTA